ncbi:MAG: MATE family efflux transporter [Planctomycetota bacterium]
MSSPPARNQDLKPHAATTNWRGEALAQARLALPVVFVQVGMMTMNVVDGLMVGRLPGDTAGPIAAVAIGGLFTWMLIGFSMGVILAVDPLVNQALGAGDRVGEARAVQRGLLLAGLLSVPVGLIILLAEPVLRWAGQPESIVPVAADYALWMIPSIPAFLAFVVLRPTLQAQHRMRPIVLVILLANLLNAALDWGFVHGRMGLPALGVVGVAMATSICRWAMLAGLLALAWPALAPRLRPLQPNLLQLRPLVGMLRLGLPIGTQMLLEMGAFALVGLSMGRLGEAELAGHYIALNLASLSFMVPLGISIAASVRVGQAVGRGDHEGLRRAVRAALVLGAGVMLLFSVVFGLLPEALARFYTPDVRVVGMAASLLPLAAAFQVFDGLQVVCSGILRGTADTKVAMLLHLLGFWVLGIPLSFVLAFTLGYGPQGLWAGLAVALAAVAGVLLLRVRWRIATLPVRVQLDEAPFVRSPRRAQPEPAATPDP